MAAASVRSRWVATAFVAAATLGASVIGASVANATTTTTGVLEVCKKASGAGVNGNFTFTVSGVNGSISVPVDGCSKPITVPAGEVTVTEGAKENFVVEAIATAPADRLVTKDLAARTAKVKVVAGDVANQTIVTFTNKTAPPKNGTVKVCKVAGSGVATGQEFAFTVGTVDTTAKAGFCSSPLTVPAGNVVVKETAAADFRASAITSAPAGTLVSSDVAAGTATITVVADRVTEVTFTNEKKTGTVKVCKIAGPGVAAGTAFGFTIGTTTTTAKAGECSAAVTLPVGEVTVKETVTSAYEATAIAVSGTGSLVSSNIATATAVVKVAVGETSVKFTNKKTNKPPNCSTVKASPGEIWPPNHKFVTVTLSGATDPDGDALTYKITGVTQDEALNGLGDGDTSPDAASVSGRTDQVQVRAERSGTGDGRVYRISFEVSDGKDKCSGTVKVSVPHDQSGAAAVDTTSVVVNSFG